MKFSYKRGLEGGVELVDKREKKEVRRTDLKNGSENGGVH